jgi:hypothetical protein
MEGYQEKYMAITKESIIEQTYHSENLPPAFAEAASRMQVTPLLQRGEFLPFAKPARPHLRSGPPARR